MSCMTLGATSQAFGIHCELMAFRHGHSLKRSLDGTGVCLFVFQSLISALPIRSIRKEFPFPTPEFRLSVIH